MFGTVSFDTPLLVKANGIYCWELNKTSFKLFNNYDIISFVTLNSTGAGVLAHTRTTSANGLYLIVLPVCSVRANKQLELSFYLLASVGTASVRAASLQHALWSILVELQVFVCDSSSVQLLNDGL